MIKNIILFILVIIILLCIGIMVIENTKTEGYTNKITTVDGSVNTLSSNSGPNGPIILTQEDKYIVMGEIIENIKNHEMLLNIYDNTYEISNLQYTPTSSLYDMYTIILPLLKKQDQEISKLKDDYILSTTIRTLQYYTSQYLGIPDDKEPVPTLLGGSTIPVYNLPDKEIAILYGIRQIIEYQDNAIQSISTKASNYIKAVYGV